MNGSFPLEKQSHVLYPSARRRLLAMILVIPKGSSVVDIGAGAGNCVRALREFGYEAFGLDGTSGIAQYSEGLVREYNLINSPPIQTVADWGLFLEVGEHVPRKHESMLIERVAAIPSKGLIVTWAGLGQPGYHHVNCRSPKYVRKQFEKLDWECDWQATNTVREKMGRDRNKTRDRLLVFRK